MINWFSFSNQLSFEKRWRCVLSFGMTNQLASWLPYLEFSAISWFKLCNQLAFEKPSKLLEVNVEFSVIN